MVGRTIEKESSYNVQMLNGAYNSNFNQCIDHIGQEIVLSHFLDLIPFKIT